MIIYYKNIFFTYQKNGVEYRIEEENLCKQCVRDGNCRIADDYKKRMSAKGRHGLENLLCGYFVLDESSVTNEEEY